MIVWADSGQAIADGSYEWEWSDYDPIVTTPPSEHHPFAPIIATRFSIAVDG